MALMGNLFARSPIRPMQQHMRAAVACAREIVPLFKDMAAGNISALAERRSQIDKLEHEADRTVERFQEKDPSMERFFDDSHAWAVFPTVGSPSVRSKSSVMWEARDCRRARTFVFASPRTAAT